MFRILKPGNVRELMTTCPDCGCVFAFLETDISEDFYFLCCQPKVTEYVNCPCCGKVITEWKAMEENYNKKVEEVLTIEPDKPLLI